MMQRYWFKPKRYGFGAAPATWEGWALTAAYILVLTALSIWLTDGAPNLDVARFTPFFIIAGVVTLIFVAICWRTTEGGWRWRWGDKD